MTLTNELKDLKDIECPDGKCVLSVYLNTDPANQDQQKGEWKIRLKNGLKRIEEYIEASGTKDELKAYKNLKKQVDNEISGNRSRLAKSVVIFGSDHQDLWKVHYLQVPVDTNFYWEPKPQLEEIEKIQKEYPRAGIIMPNNDEVRIISTSLGEVLDEWNYEFDSNKEEWSLNEGMASSDRTASSASHVDKFQQRFEENKHRFYKDMAQKIEKMKKTNEWEAMYVVGETEMARSFEEVMQTKPDGKVTKNLNNAETTKVLNEVFK